MKIFAPFHFGLVLAVSRKFHDSLRTEVADQAKKTRLGLSLLPVLSPLLQHEPDVLGTGPQKLLGGRGGICGVCRRMGL